MHYFVYKTTCSVTDKYYIGVHSTSNLDDGYLGSGILLKRSVSKHGSEVHSREILKEFESLDEAFSYEADIVSSDLVSDPLCLNLKVGGSGGWAYPETQSKASEAGNLRLKELWNSDPVWAASVSKTSSDRRKEEFASGARPNTHWFELNEEFRSRAMSEESRGKRLDTFAVIGHQQGETNSQFGTCWVSNEVETIKISKDSFTKYLELGYVRGRKLKSI